MSISSFNRRGDSLGGATKNTSSCSTSGYTQFQSQRRFFGGSNLCDLSIESVVATFQSQRRFFGGSNAANSSVLALTSSVSIAEAILWGEQLPIIDWQFATEAVSIAEAILWGEQRIFLTVSLPNDSSFNRRGDSLGGATPRSYSPRGAVMPFQSQRRFFGGSNFRARLFVFYIMEFQSQRRFFGGSNWAVWGVEWWT